MAHVIEGLQRGLRRGECGQKDSCTCFITLIMTPNCPELSSDYKVPTEFDQHQPLTIFDFIYQQEKNKIMADMLAEKMSSNLKM